MELNLIKILSKKFSSRLYPAMFGDLAISILTELSSQAGYAAKAYMPTVTSRNPLKTDIDIENLVITKESIFGFSCNVGNIKDSVQLARQIKSKNQNSTILFGGPHFDEINSKVILRENPFIDYIFIGPAEQNFAKFLTRKDSQQSITGLVSRTGNAEPVCAKIEYEVQERFPFQDSIERFDKEDRKKFTIPIQTSFGCNGFCTFCYRPFKGWHGMPAEQVIEKFEFYIRNGFTKFLIVDDNFIGTDLERARKIAEGLHALKQKHQAISFEFDARADSFGRYDKNCFEHELIEKLIAAGLRKIFVGIESGNGTDLRLLRKFPANIDPVKQNIYFLENMKQHRVSIAPGFIMLTEDSDLDSVINNIKFIATYLPPQISPEIYWYQLSYYPGSELTKKKIAELESKGDSKGISEIVYGQYIPKYKNSFAQQFSAILEKVKTRFRTLDDQLDYARIEETIKGDTFRAAHTYYFMKYAEYASKQDVLSADALINEHYEEILKIIFGATKPAFVKIRRTYNGRQ